MGDIEQLVDAFVEELEVLIDREARARATQALAQVGGVTPPRPSPPHPRAPRRPQVAPKGKPRRIVRAAPPPAPRRARRVTSSFSPSIEAPKEEQSASVAPAALERAIAVAVMGEELADQMVAYPRTPAPALVAELRHRILTSKIDREVTDDEPVATGPAAPAPAVGASPGAGVGAAPVVAAWKPGAVVVARVAGADQVVTIERVSSKSGTWVVRVMETNKLFVVVTAAIVRAATAKEKRLTRAAAPQPTEGP